MRVEVRGARSIGGLVDGILGAAGASSYVGGLLEVMKVPPPPHHAVIASSPACSSVTPRSSHTVHGRAFEKTGRRVGGSVDWSQVSASEIQSLTNRMFDAAGVPNSARAEYFRAFHQYVYGVGP